jgi:hypothetical protein
MPRNGQFDLSMPLASLPFVCSGLSFFYVRVIALPNSYKNDHLEENTIAILSLTILNSARGLSLAGQQ